MTRSGNLSSEAANILLQAWSEIAGETDLDKVFRAVTLSAKHLTNSNQASLALIEGEKLHFVYATSQGEAVPRLRISIGKGIPGKVALDGLPRQIKQGRYCSPVSHAGNEAQQSFKNKSMLCVPMIFQQRPVGTIQVFDKIGSDEFSEHDSTALQMLANHAATTVELLKLYERHLHESRRITGIFEALTDGIMLVDNAGNPITYNKAVEEMFFPDGQQNFALTTYLSSIIRAGDDSGRSEVALFKPHNLFLSNRFVALRDAAGNPSEFVISIRNITDQRNLDRRFSQFYALMLHKSQRVVNRAYKKSKLGAMRRGLRRQKAILRNLIALTELKSGPLRIEKESCNLNEIYSRTRDWALPRLSRRKITLKDDEILASSPTGGRFDRPRVTRMFRSLLGKGIFALAKGGEICVVSNHGPEGVRFEVLYTGPGVTTNINPQCLDWNLQVDRIISGESTTLDLDLAFTGHIANAHKGSIQIATSGDNEARVTIALPLE